MNFRIFREQNYSLGRLTPRPSATHGEDNSHTAPDAIQDGALMIDAVHSFSLAFHFFCRRITTHSLVEGITVIHYVHTSDTGCNIVYVTNVFIPGLFFYFIFYLFFIPGLSLVRRRRLTLFHGRTYNFTEKSKSERKNHPKNE